MSVRHHRRYTRSYHHLFLALALHRLFRPDRAHLFRPCHLCRLYRLYRPFRLVVRFHRYHPSLRWLSRRGIPMSVRHHRRYTRSYHHLFLALALHRLFRPDRAHLFLPCRLCHLYRLYRPSAPTRQSNYSRQNHHCTSTV